MIQTFVTYHAKLSRYIVAENVHYLVVLNKEIMYSTCNNQTVKFTNKLKLTTHYEIN